MSDESENAYTNGERAALVGMIRHCLRELGYNASAEKCPDMVVEREETMAALRELCSDKGIPNDWPDELHMADVVTKRLARGLA